jgi:AsmA-like C-terminal region
MSDTIVESMPRAEAMRPAQSRNRPRPLARFLKWAALILVVLWISGEGISLAIQHTRLRRVLTARMEAAFGRPVEVRRYGFNIWNGPEVEAESVTVRDDPRFGQEYFLRAESMTVRLRWASLLRGHLELGTLSLSRPSLNLVRSATGDWNLVDWLPRPSGSPVSPVPVGPALPFSPLRFNRIEVDGGRINFKNGDEKLPFAFVGVRGTVETDRPGRWLMNLDATPWRAAVVVQQAGTIHVSGDLGGTSSRLRPAALAVSWTNASISDVLRLAGRDDLGIRGALALAVDARTQDHDDGWAIQGRAELRQVHRWDLALRADTPSVNLIARTIWNPAAPVIYLTDVTLEAPHSSARASGRIGWNQSAVRPKEQSPSVQMTVSSILDATDLLPWLRAFRPAVADNVGVRGNAEIRAEVSGWPLRIVNAVVSSSGLEFSSTNFRRSARSSPLQLRYDQGLLSLLPVSLAFGGQDDSLHFESSAKLGRVVSNSIHLSADILDVHDVIATASALGWNLARGWDISGPVRADLRWQGAQYPWQSPPLGTIHWGAGPGLAVLRVPFLNQPIVGIDAVSEWKAGARHITLASAQAFGARWSGTLDRRDSGGDWQFALSADRLAAADLDRWLNPAWRQSFLGRMLPFLSSPSPANAAPENLRASGRLSLDQFTLAPFSVRDLKGNLEIEGRRIAFTDATGEFYGGQVGGSLTADLQAAPFYHADLAFSRVDIPSFIAATPILADVHAESATGEISLDARGAARADVIASLTCQGSVRATGPELLNVDLSKALAGRSQGSGSTRFLGASATFSCAHNKIDFQSLSLITGADSSVIGSGTIDFSRNLDLRFRTAASDAAARRETFRLTGTLAAPKVLLPQPPPARRSR